MYLFHRKLNYGIEKRRFNRPFLWALGLQKKACFQGKLMIKSWSLGSFSDELGMYCNSHAMHALVLGMIFVVLHLLGGY